MCCRSFPRLLQLFLGLCSVQDSSLLCCLQEDLVKAIPRLDPIVRLSCLGHGFWSKSD